MEQKQEIRSLWSLCFDDTEAFKDFYFERRYKENENFCLHRDGKVIAALQVIPYSMGGWSHYIPTGYVSGACTHPDYRGQGVMRNLMTKTMETMYQHVNPLMTLIPATESLFSFYERLGFSPIFRNEEKELNVTDLQKELSCEVREIEKWTPALESFMQEGLCRRGFAVLHQTSEDWADILTDLHLDNGSVWVAESIKGEIWGVLLAIPREDGCLQVKDWICSEEGKHCTNTLFAVAAEQRGCTRITYSEVPVYGGQGKACGMARVIHAYWLLKHFAKEYPGEEFSLELKDELIPKNNSYYTISEGTCVKSDYLFEVDYRFDAAGLTDFLFGQEGASLSLMLD